MDEYFIGTGTDGLHHIYKKTVSAVSQDGFTLYPRNETEDCSVSWEGLLLTVDPRQFSNYLIKPRDIGDEFESVGRTFVIVNLNYRNDFVCAVADAVGYRLLLHNLIWWTELRLEDRFWWASIPRKVRDQIDTPELWADVREYATLFREKRNARRNAGLVEGQAASV